MLIVEGLLGMLISKEIKVGLTLDIMAVLKTMHLRKCLTGGNEAAFFVLNVNAVGCLLHQALEKSLGGGAQQQ